VGENYTAVNNFNK